MVACIITKADETYEIYQKAISYQVINQVWTKITVLISHIEEYQMRRNFSYIKGINIWYSAYIEVPN